MEHAFFFLFSFAEFAAGLAFVLALFRFDYVEYRTHIMYSAFLLTEISYLLRMGFDLEPISLVFQMIALIVMFILMYQFPIFYAVLTGVIGYITVGLTQMGIILLSSFFVPYSFDQIVDNSTYGYVMQSITSLFAFGLAKVLNHFHIGFKLIPKKNTTVTTQLKMDTYNILILTVMLITALTILTFSYYLFDQRLPYVFLMMIMTLQTIILIYLAIRREAKHD